MWYLTLMSAYGIWRAGRGGLSVIGDIELRLARAPLIRFGLFRSRSLSGANIVMFLIGAAFFSMWYFLSLYLQNVLGDSALKTGLAFLPMGVTIMIGAQASSRILPRVGVRPLLQADSSRWLWACCSPRWRRRPPRASRSARPGWPRACSTPRGR